MSLNFGVNQALVEDQLRRYLVNPGSVEPEWRRYFESLDGEERAALGIVGSTTNGAKPAPVAGPGRAQAPRTALGRAVASEGGDRHSPVELAWRLSRLVAAFRSRGHYYAQIDPLGLTNEDPAGFDPAAFGISEADLDTPVATDIASLPESTPRQILARMWQTYCGTIGYEVMHTEDSEERNWLLERIEAQPTRPAMEPALARWVLRRLTDAQELESFLHNTYVGVKRFSLEGLETVIPMLDAMIDGAGDGGVTDVVIGMAHRGRLNVLVNTLGKQHRELFVAFNDEDSETLVGRGDVKYHLGHSSDRTTAAGNPVHISLCFNPSHLEFVNPVVVGRARARLDVRGDTTGASVLPLMIHGDAAFIGQGIVAETLNLAELEGYRVGGSLHLVLNNQVGFTTSPSDSRSSRYASDLVRFLRVPVFHVNADDLDAVMFVAQLAVDYRRKFNRDVCIDLVGYRKYGHNEGDEPRFTQPQMYAVIDARDSVRDRFAAKLVADGVVGAQEPAEMVAACRAELAAAHAASKASPTHAVPHLAESAWDEFFGGPWDDVFEVDTTVSDDDLRQLLHLVAQPHDEDEAHPKVRKVYEARASIAQTSGPFDWGSAEMLAFASLVHEGRRVRVSGQDSRRGTFSHRHSYITNMKTGGRLSPLNRAARDGGWYEAFDSPLSEAAVLGFEYGYSLEAPADLVIWEAQFGDFANGAQVIIDQFIASGEDKWGRLTGLVMLLPHGFEGMGPEHSYARLGRFLQLCAEDNMIVCDCTTPAQFFHLLRRQVLSPWRKPLVVMSPKSLLRHKRAQSTLAELSSGGFQRVIPDVGGAPAGQVRRVLLCSGRIYFDLEQERDARGATDVHIVRLEQLYPLDARLLQRVLSQYGSGTELVWVQDEPWNLGAWYFIKARLQAIFGDGLPLTCVARAESASPATGSAAAHKTEHRSLMDAAFARPSR
ncbi:MAG: 2-oxoglutarate dehydrogenase E1 component [Myxococcales bacterium]|nr:2-oxoglutarate dehydrogenase E1 component [Myxococcales bacterium]MCB9519345.1 2-oxoglutarate dehydrogenase E1 component [Myxococcales bacterium]MCB9530789.1 2-oxoglutarate dehydrogenase E1 component [Myxococcales bacterium]